MQVLYTTGMQGSVLGFYMCDEASHGLVLPLRPVGLWVPVVYTQAVEICYSWDDTLLGCALYSLPAARSQKPGRVIKRCITISPPKELAEVEYLSPKPSGRMQTRPICGLPRRSSSRLRLTHLV